MIHQPGASAPAAVVVDAGAFESASSNLAGSLIQVGTDLFEKGFEHDALAMFDSANSLLMQRAPTDESVCPSAVPQLHASSQVLLGGGLCQDMIKEPAADMYQEDECDVGPRVLREPVRPGHVASPAFLETCLVFNQALIYHERQELGTACRLYRGVLQSLAEHLDGSSAPSQQLIEMGTRAHNNMGCIHYMIGEEDLSKAHFEAALICSRRIANATRAQRLQYATILSNCCRVAWMEDTMTDQLYTSLREVLALRAAELPWDHADVAAAHYNLGVAEYARRTASHGAASAHLLQYLRVAAHRAQTQRNDLDAVPALIYLLLIQNEDKDDHLSQELARGLRTLQDKRQEQGAESPEVASVLNFIGTILFHKKDYEKALTFFQEELRLEEIICGDSTEDIAVSVTCNNIGRILQEMGRMNDAVHYYQRALKAEFGDVNRVCKGFSVTVDATRKNVTESYPSFANLYSTVWYNLGLIHDKLGAYSDAIHAFNMSLELRKAMLGQDHPDVACLLYNIGVLQMEQQDLKEASRSFREVLRIRRLGSADQLVDQHVVKTLEKLACLHKAKGDVAGALEASHEVLRIQEVSPDYETITRLRETGVTLRCIAELQQATGDLVAAIKNCSKSVERLEQAILVDQSNLSSHTPDKVAKMEQFVSSLLLMGSLYHESCEPLQAHAVLHRAAMAVQHAMASSTAYASMSPLGEVTNMLGAIHGAACA